MQRLKRWYIYVFEDADIVIKCNGATIETRTSVTTPVSTVSTSSLPIAVTGESLYLRPIIATLEG